MASAARRKWAQAKRVAPTPKPQLKIVSPVDDPAVEAMLSRKTVEASVKLRSARGEVFLRPKSKDQPHQVLDELDIMLSRGEISRMQFKAGRLYGDHYREAVLRNTTRSSIRFNDRSRTGDNYDVIMIDRLQVYRKLHADRQRAFGNNRRPIALCDALLGEDCRIAASGDARKRIVDYVSWALTRLAYNYGLLGW